MRTYLTETAVLTVGLLFLASASFAGPFGLPDHEPNGFRDTGCLEEAQVAITNEAGDILYWNNPTCPRVKSPADKVAEEESPVEPPAEEPPVEVAEPPAVTPPTVEPPVEKEPKEKA